jgi:hypothetical protein
MDSYRTIEQKLIEYKPFKGNSMWARHEGDEYVVYSYSTRIARCAMNVMWHDVPARKYSTTTSRHQNLIRKAWGIK